MKNFKDILQVVGVFTCLILPFVLAQLWFWVAFFGAVLALFGVFEVLAYIRTGRTLSQQVGDYGKKHPLRRNLMLGSMLIGWLLLLWHLYG